MEKVTSDTRPHSPESFPKALPWNVQAPSPAEKAIGKAKGEGTFENLLGSDHRI